MSRVLSSGESRLARHLPHVLVTLSAALLSALVIGTPVARCDIALAWGPMAAYFARRQRVALRIVPVSASPDEAAAFEYAIGMAVRKKDGALRDELDRVIGRHRSEIDRLLAAYDVPRIDRPSETADHGPSLAPRLQNSTSR